MGISFRPVVAGPLSRAPSAMAKVELCAGQVATPSFGAVTLTPLCGQAASYALNVPATGWTSRTPPTTVPPPTGTSAAAARLSAGEGSVAAGVDRAAPGGAAAAGGSWS